MGKIRIAYFLDVMEENFDGVSITMHQVIKRIPKDEFEVIFITPHPPKEDIGFPIYECPYFRIPEKNKDYRFGLPKRMKNLESILDEFQPTLLHYSSPTALGKYAVRYGNKHQIPVLSIYHTHYPSFADYYFGPLAKWNAFVRFVAVNWYRMYFKTNLILVPTKPMKDYLLDLGINKKALNVWGRGVDTERFNPGKRKDDLWPTINADHLKVLFVSRLTREKEPQTLIRLYRLMKRNRAKITMIVVGDGPMREMLEKKMPEAIFMGKQYGENLSEAYASADVFIFPSTTETFGNVVLEALASGLPVVAANAGGPSDIVRDGETGFLVEPQKEEAFYDGIAQLLVSNELRLEMSKNAVAYAESQSWEKLSDQLFEKYKEVVR